MRRPILKNSNKKLKGNISLLVILILLASSVIGLLSINQIQRLITYGNMTFNYFRAFYLAKAGTELGLTEVYYREAGFNHTVNSGDAIVSGNLNEAFSGFNPYFEMAISGSFKTLTNDVRNSECEGNEIVLGSGAGIMISLFSDETEGLGNILTGEEGKLKGLTENQIENLTMSSNNGNLTFGLFSYKKDEEGQEYMYNVVVINNQTSLLKFFSDENVQTIINDNSTTKKYLTIKNSGNEEVKFCISMGGADIPSSDSLITVRGNYGDMEVGLQSVVKKGVPDWALNVLGSEELNQ